MKHLLYSLSRLLIVFLSSAIVFFALVVLVGHILTPYLNKQVQAISNLAGKLLNQPVQIKQFSMVWQGLTPIFHGSQVIIWDDKRTHPLLSVKQLNIGVDIFNSLLSGNIKLGEVNVNGIELVAHQTKDNQVIFTGISALFNQTSRINPNGINELMAWLLAEPQLSLENVKLKFYPKSGPVWPMMHINVLLKNNGNQHQLSGQLQLLQEKFSELSFKADLNGAAPFSQNNLSGPIYLQGQNILLDRWFNQWESLPRLQNTKANFRIWASWQRDHLNRIQVLLTNLQTATVKINKQPTFNLMPFSAHILWQTPSLGEWTIDAIVNNFGCLPWKKIPGIQGLDAYIHMTPTSGDLKAHSNNFRIDFTKLFKAPIHLDSLSTQLNWQQAEGEYLIRVPKFTAINQDVSINSQFALLVPKPPIPLQLSLLAHVKIVNSKNISNYLPQTLLGPKLIHWLSRSITKGSGLGSLVLQGPLNQFPFDQHNGTFLIDTQIKNATLNDQQDWPILRQINGELIFSGRQMQVLVDSVEILGSILKDIKANIPIIKKNLQAILHITSGEMFTTLEKGQVFLAATPLSQQGTLSQLKNLILTGPLQLSLQIAIPLESGKEKLKLLGAASIENAKIKIPSHNIQLDQVKGPFSFNQDGLSAQKLIGVLWGKPIELAIHSTPNLQITIHYDDILTNLKPEKNGWRFTINNKTAKGSVLIPNSNQQAIQANFDTIYLDSSIESNNVNTWNLKQLPRINLNASQVYYKDIKFGAVQLKLSPILGGVLVRELNAGDENYHLIASGAWHTQDANSTELMGQLDSPNLNNFLRSWGLPASIIAEQAHIRFKLNWPGAPYHVSLSKLSGHFSFNASNGQIVDIGSSNEAKLNFGRLLTFLSIQSITKRLQLDFSDLKTKGFDFTTFEGNFILRNGNAITRDVRIEGPVASIGITGRIGILNKDYDLVIKVVPHFTSSLPVIVGLAGGPVAGVVAWLANAVLGSTVQKIAQTSYHITGSWIKPDVVKTST